MKAGSDGSPALSVTERSNELRHKEWVLWCKGEDTGGDPREGYQQADSKQHRQGERKRTGKYLAQAYRRIVYRRFDDEYGYAERWCQEADFNRHYSQDAEPRSGRPEAARGLAA